MHNCSRHVATVVPRGDVTYQHAVVPMVRAHVILSLNNAANSMHSQRMGHNTPMTRISR